MKNSKTLILLGGTAVIKKNNQFLLKENFKIYIEKISLQFNKIIWIVPETANIDLKSSIESNKIKIVTYNKTLFSILNINFKLIFFLIMNLRSYILLFPSPLLIFNLPFIFFLSKNFVYYIGVDFFEVIKEKKIKSILGWKILFKYSYILPMMLAKTVLVRGLYLKKIANKYNKNVKLSLPISWTENTKDEQLNNNLSDNNNILYMGKIIKEKGIFELVNSYKILKHKYKNKIFNLFFVGDGKDLIKLKQFVKKNSISDVVFFGWIENYTTLKKIFLDSKVIVCPTLKGYPEGVPRVIEDAGKFNIPAIVSKVGGMADEFADGSAYIYGSNGELLEDSIYKILFDNELRKSILNKYKAKNSNFPFNHAFEQHLHYLINSNAK